MGKAVVIGVKFDWNDVKDAKNYKEFYDIIGLTKIVENSHKNPDEYGGEIIKKNIYATPYVASKIATVFMNNILQEYVEGLKKLNDDEKADLDKIFERISADEYTSGFEAGSVGPEFCSVETSDTMRVMHDNDDDFSEMSPVIWIFQDGTHEFVKPRKGESKDFLKLIKSIDKATRTTKKLYKELDKE